VSKNVERPRLRKRIGVCPVDQPIVRRPRPQARLRERRFRVQPPQGFPTAL